MSEPVPEPPYLRLVRGDRSGDPLIRTRVLPGRAGEPSLELLEGAPEGEAAGPPLLFLHGAFGGAWTWREVFLPHCVRRGRHVAAVSLRGHGRSGGYDGLRRWRLSDYLDDVRRACSALPEPPVVVGHSLGGLLAQMLVGRVPLRGLALLASLPPEGMLFVGPRIMATDPVLWIEALLGSMSKGRRLSAAAAWRLMFSDRLSPEQLRLYASRMTPEAPRALADAHAPGLVLSAALAATPTLVIGAEFDRLVWHPSTLRTAAYHAGEHQVAEGMGHALQLDIGAESIAQRVLDWVDRAVA